MAWHTPALSQEHDAIHKKLKESMPDSSRILIYADLSFRFIFSDYDSSDYYAQLGLSLAKKINFQKGTALIYNHQGVMLRIQGSYPEAVDKHLQSLQICEKIGDLPGQANNFVNMGLVYKEQGNLSVAVDYYTKCMEIKERMDDKEGLSFVYKDLADIYVLKGDYRESAIFYQKALAIRQGGSSAGIYLALSKLYQKQGKYEEAFDFLNKALPIFQQHLDEHGIVEVYINHALIYQATGKYIQAKQYAERAYQSAIKHRYRKEQRDAAMLLATLLKAIDKPHEAYGYLYEYTQLQDSLFSKESYEKASQLQSKFQSQKKQMEIELLKQEQALKNKELEQRAQFIFGLAALLASITVLLVVLYRNNLRKQQTNVVLHQQSKEIESKSVAIKLANEELAATNEELRQVQDEIMAQRDSLEHKNVLLENYAEKMNQNINAATLIQTSILPTPHRMADLFEEHFVLFLPKDVVSGDFWWASNINGSAYLIVADCSGHGVPGAMLTMLGTSILDKIIKVMNILEPDEILEALHNEFKEAFQRPNAPEGMDVAIVRLRQQTDDTVQVDFAAAKRPLYITTPDSAQKIGGTRRTIGGVRMSDKPFETQQLILPKGSKLFLSSDGYIDQNNPQRKRFSEQQFLNMLGQSHHLGMEEQQKLLQTALEEHSQEEEQRDDILVIGVRV